MVIYMKHSSSRRPLESYLTGQMNRSRATHHYITVLPTNTAKQPTKGLPLHMVAPLEPLILSTQPLHSELVIPSHHGGDVVGIHLHGLEEAQ